MGLTVFENLKFRKFLFLTSLDAAREPHAESLILEFWNLLAEELEPEYLFYRKPLDQLSTVRAQLRCLSKIQDIPKCLFFLSLDTARRPYA